MYEFRLDFFRHNGQKITEVVDYLAAEAEMLVNRPSVLSVQLPARHRVFSELEERSRIELWARDVEMGMSWKQFFGGIYLAQRRDYAQQSITTVSAMSYLWLLRMRINAYPSNVLNRTRFENLPAETIMKMMFRYNFNPHLAIIAEGRLRNALEWPAGIVSEEQDGYRGNVMPVWYSAQADLIDNFGELAKKGGGDFDIVRNEDGRLWFKYFPGQRGQNRLSTVAFSLERGNMGYARFTQNRVAEATVAIVGGQGDNITRDFAVVELTGLGPLDYVETFVPATHVEPGKVAGLVVAGEKKLYDTRRIQSFEFNIIQTANSRYMVHYDLGDRVSAFNPYLEDTFSHKVVQARVRLAQGQAPDIEVTAESTNDD